MLGAIFKSLADLFSVELRGFVWRSVGLTVLVLLVTGGAIVSAIDWALNATTWHETYPWVETYLVILSSVGILIGGLYLLPAVSMLVAGFFLEDVASVIEKRIDPSAKPGQAMSITSSLIEGVKFFGLTLAANALALIVLFVPGINFVIYLAINSVLFGREYFYLVTGRHRSRGAILMAYRKSRNVIWLAGLVIAIFAIIPFLNLLTPLFATILMVRIQSQIASDKRT